MANIVLPQVDILSEINNDTNVLIEQNGIIQRANKNTFLDTSLTKQGMAADAKAVGDIIDTFSNKNIINVKNYGATGDGVTDDTNAIAAAIEILPLGGILYFPAGIYRVSSIFLKSDMTVQGDGWCSVIQLLDSAHIQDGIEDYTQRNNCLHIQGTKDNPIKNIIVKDIKLDGRRSTQVSGGASADGRLDGLMIRYASDIHVENVWMYNNGYHGCIMTYCTNVVFERCLSTDNGFRPIHGHTQIYNCRIANCVCENNGLGLTGGSGFENDSVFFFGASGLVIEGNIVRSNRRGCITVAPEQGENTAENDLIPSLSIAITGNVCECYEDLEYIPTQDSDTGVAKFESMGIVVIGGDHILNTVTVTGNTIRNAHKAISLFSQENNIISINTAITGNTIIDCSYGIHATEIKDVNITGNQFKNLKKMLFKATSCEQCMIHGNNIYALNIDQNYLCQLSYCNNIIIQDNYMISNCVYGIYAPESNSNIVAMNNTMVDFKGVKPIKNPNGYTQNNLYIDTSLDRNIEKICIDPYSNAGFVRPTLVNPNTSSNYWRYTTPTEMTDKDIKYELNTYASVPNGTKPQDYDFSTLNTAIVFLAGTELTSAVGIANLANNNGEIIFSDNGFAGTTNTTWGVQITLTAETVKNLFPTATHVMMQVQSTSADPDNLIPENLALSNGHAYVYREK